MGDKTIVQVDFWENQTYKSLQGSWSAPIYGIQKFSDATGKVAFKHEKVANESVYLPTGWEWCDKQWVIDNSDKFGEVDAEGWGYAATVEALVENTRQHALKADRSTGNINRRRRWIRHRRCVALDVVTVHEERVEWAEGIRAKMKEIEEASRENFHKLNDYYSGQKEAVEKVIIGTDNTILEVIHEFSELNERLHALKTFLLERGAIEESYAQKLDSFSKKWIHEGDAKKFTPAPHAAQPSAQLLTTDPNVDIFAAEGSATAFWNTTTTALKSAANSTTQQVQQVATNTASAATMVGSAASTVVSNVATNVTTNARRYSDFDMGSAYGPPEPTDLSASGENSPVKGTTAVPDVIITGPDAFVSVNPMQKKKSVANVNGSGASTPTTPGTPTRAASLSMSATTPTATTATPATTAAAVSSATNTSTNNDTTVSHPNTTTTGTATTRNETGRRGSGSIVDAYYYSVSLAKRTMAERLHSYAQLLTQILPQQVDTIVEMVKEATAECRNEGREIRSCLMSNCKTTDQYFNTYAHTFEQSQVELRADSKILANAMYQSSATIDSAAQDVALNSLSMLAGCAGDMSATGDALAVAVNRFTNLESQDLWLAIQLYFTGANSVDSTLLMYHAFSRLQLRKLRDISACLDELLQLTLRTFSSDQFHAWEDCSSALAMLGSFRDVLVLQCNVPETSPNEAEAGTTEGSEGKPKSGKGKISRFINSNPVLVARNEQFAQDMNARGIPRHKSLPPSSHTDSADSDKEDEGLEASGRNNASVFRKHFFSRERADPYIAYHGRISYCTTTRAEAHAGGQDFSEHSMWTEASVLVTYNKVMHIMHLSQDYAGKSDDLKFVKENVIMSVNLRNVLVRPLNIPREGYRDAFEVLLAGSASKKMSLLGSLSASSKDITAIMFLTHDSFQMRSWMRVISNPFLDPSKELPDAIPAAPGLTPNGSASPAPSIRDRKDSEAYSFSGGGDGEMISGTNSLRDGTRLTRAASSSLAPAPHGSPATPSTAERFNAYTGSDAVNGSNALRNLKRAPSMRNNNSTAASLSNAFNAAASVSESAVTTSTPASSVPVEVSPVSEPADVKDETVG